MKTLLKQVLVWIGCAIVFSATGQTKAEKQGWRLGIQSYSFHRFSLIEAFDKTQELGIRYIEVYPGHRLGGKWGDRPFDFNLDRQTQEELKQLAASKGIKIVASGVFVAEHSSDWEKMFRFANEMEMEFITCEPALEDWDLVEKLAEQYQLKVAVHNHPQPSDYWKPANLLAAISNRSQLIGSCSDVGHWRREGLDQLACLKELDGRIRSLHFKDIAPKETDGTEQHDVIWGSGILQVKEMLEELHRQRFQGVLSIEYEYNWDNSIPDIRQCIRYFEQVSDEILAE